VEIVYFNEHIIAHQWLNELDWIKMESKNRQLNGERGGTLLVPIRVSVHFPLYAASNTLADIDLNFFLN
jgi:hypothetical protein